MADTPVAVVTGASQGLGLETCRQLLTRGFRVILTARAADSVERGIAALNSAALSGHVLDPANDASVAAFVLWLEQQVGRLDVLVNNAGRLYNAAEQAPTVAELLEAIDNNALGPWRLSQACLPLLSQSPQGRIVNVSSGMGALTDMGSGASAYRMSKTALNAVTRMLANQLPDNVKVNSVCPGWVRTEMGGADAERAVEAGAASIVWAATIAADGPTGGFFRDGQALDW